MYSALHVMQWFSHISDVFTPKIRRKFFDFYILWIKTKIVYTRFEVIAKTKYCTTSTALNWFVTLFYKLLPAVSLSSKHGRRRSSLLLYSISAVQKILNQTAMTDIMAVLLSSIGYVDVTTLLISAGIFLVIFWRLKQYARYQNLPPGPAGWPILGYLPNLGISQYRSGKQPFHLFTDLGNKYGKVYSMYMGSRLVIILNGHESIKEAFMNQLLNDRPAVNIQSEANTGRLYQSAKSLIF